MCLRETEKFFSVFFSIFVLFILRWFHFPSILLSALTMWEWVVVDVCTTLERGSVQLDVASATAIVKLENWFPSIKTYSSLAIDYTDTKLCKGICFGS
ncbi:hypothetical protein EXN66_Car002873 [Channa argus]|uniref:Uncharacterized protein n=1 Tax=Channa argus TaxID=215402 RepID=A0A6G1PA79_CHAAH|nr:hypothetical protein EXN66_Car002873 [Channa argus]